MENADNNLKSIIIKAVSMGVQPLPEVLAGWECGSVAFNLEDKYSDIDLNILLMDGCNTDAIYGAVISALETVSPIEASHSEPPGRYFKLRDGGDYLLVDVCMYRTEELAERLDKSRHGNIIPLFDKGGWLTQGATSDLSRSVVIANRIKDHQMWFSVSQNFVRKAIFRNRQVEALAAYWGHTLKPLVELLRIKHCPDRWDFGMRYLEKDLPDTVYDKLCSIIFVGDPNDLTKNLSEATSWAEQLLLELGNVMDSSPKAG